MFWKKKRKIDHSAGSANRALGISDEVIKDVGDELLEIAKRETLYSKVVERVINKMEESDEFMRTAVCLHMNLIRGIVDGKIVVIQVPPTLQKNQVSKFVSNTIEALHTGTSIDIPGAEESCEKCEDGETRDTEAKDIERANDTERLPDGRFIN